MLFSLRDVKAIFVRRVELLSLLLPVKRAYIAVVMALSLLLSHAAYAQTGRPISGVIAATDKPIAISYVNEDGKKIGRIAGVGEPIYLNDEISTPAGASLQVLLRDQTVFSIGPNSTLVFDEFIFDPTNDTDLALTASVKKGTFKFISGKISKLKPGAMTLKLPNATASVRGTSVVGRVDDAGASDIVLLTGAVQLQATGTDVAVDLITPGWGISIADTGAASDPQPFPEEAISEIIQQVEFVEEQDEATTEDQSADGEAAGAAATEDENTQEAVEEETVETIVTAIQDAGEDISEDEIISIIEESEGNPEAVAEAIVKVIIENQIERGEVSPELLQSFETIDGEALFSEDFDPETFDVAALGLEELDVEGIKIEDLGLQDFAFDEQASFVEAFSQRLDAEGVELPSFEPAEFTFTEASFGFDDAQFEDVFFEPVNFEKEFATSTKFDIKDVSSLILGNEFEGTDTPDIELSFFDILFNAETINEEINRREIEFNEFEAQQASFADDAKEQAPVIDDAVDTGAVEIDAKVPSFVVSRDSATGLAVVSFAQPPEGEGADGGASFTDTQQFDAKEQDENARPPEATEVFFAKLYEEKVPAEIEQQKIETETIDRQTIEANQLEYEAFLSRLQQEYGDTNVDPLEAYQSGRAGAVWLTYQSGGVLGNPNQFDELISQTYEGTARFVDSLTISDANTAFKARSSYDVTLNYSNAELTGKFVLSNMTLNSNAYVGPTGETSYTQILDQTLSSSNQKLPSTNNVGALIGGDDENGNGQLDVGETIEGVRIAEVDFHDSATGSEITSRVRTTLDMSVGSTATGNAALNGTLGEFVIKSEEYTCNANCGTISKTGTVGLGISQVAAE